MTACFQLLSLPTTIAHGSQLETPTDEYSALDCSPGTVEYLTNSFKSTEGQNEAGIHHDPETFLKDWLQPYAGHMAYVMGRDNGTHMTPPGYPSFADADASPGLNKRLRELCFLMMCLPSIEWRPVLLLAMHKLSSMQKKKNTAIGAAAALEVFLVHLEHLEVEMQLKTGTGFGVAKRRGIYKRVMADLIDLDESLSGSRLQKHIDGELCLLMSTHYCVNRLIQIACCSNFVSFLN